MSSQHQSVYCQQCGGATSSQVVENRSRPVCRQCGAVTYLDPKLSVAVIIVCQGRLVLGRRAEGARQSGKWSFPAGFVERGEVVEAAAIREVREEVGLEVALGPLVGVYSEDGDEVVLVVYSASQVCGKLRADDDMDRAAWFRRDDLPELAFPRDVRILEDWNLLRLEDSVQCDVI